MPDIDELINAAFEVRQRAYAPYSKFLVGAALAIQGCDQPVVGCNVENASYGLSICAERMAIGTAVSQGILVPGRQTPEKQDEELGTLVTVVVAATPLATPCGACRQFLSEFNLNADIICVDPQDPAKTQQWKLAELLPDSFQF